MSTPKTIVAASAVLLLLSAAFGLLNAAKSRSLRAEIISSESVRRDAERSSAQREREIKAREMATTPAGTRPGENQTKVAAAEVELVKAQSDKEELQAKLRANEAEVAELRSRIEANGASAVSEAAPAASTTELQAQLVETRNQLEAAEREKTLLSDKMAAARERSTQLETEKKRRVATTGNPDIRGTVLAVNQAYNFVVLNLGGRHGIEANSEMLVLRGGSLIGRIRISSVEPATAIGDIMTNSLARGVQVQPGDTVIYAGSNS